MTSHILGTVYVISMARRLLFSSIRSLSHYLNLFSVKHNDPWQILCESIKIVATLMLSRLLKKKLFPLYKISIAHSFCDWHNFMKFIIWLVLLIRWFVRRFFFCLVRMFRMYVRWLWLAPSKTKFYDCFVFIRVLTNLLFLFYSQILHFSLKCR